MKAVVFRGAEDVRVEEVAEPRLEAPTDALVEVRAAAICGADLFPYHGLTPGFETGTILGHEFVGIVLEVGTAVTAVQPGQRVVNTSLVLDGSCVYCRRGLPTQCTGRALFGYSGVYPRLDGAQAELVRVPNADRVLAPLPESIPDEAGVFLSDNLPTGYDAVARGGAKKGDSVCVVGCGAVGLMDVMCAVDVGAEVGADVVVEAAGTPGALDAALRLARGRGVVSVVGAHFEPDYPLNNALMFERELTLRFSIGDAAGHQPGLVQALAAGRFDPARVVTHRLALADAVEAYRLFDSRKATKVVLAP
jgi:alcohol dehydrogenase